MSPFKSKAQQKKLFATKPKLAKEFADKTPNMKNLPEKKKPSTKTGAKARKKALPPWLKSKSKKVGAGQGAGDLLATVPMSGPMNHDPLLEYPSSGGARTGLSPGATVPMTPGMISPQSANRAMLPMQIPPGPLGVPTAPPRPGPLTDKPIPPGQVPAGVRGAGGVGKKVGRGQATGTAVMSAQIKPLVAKKAKTARGFRKPGAGPDRD